MDLVLFSGNMRALPQLRELVFCLLEGGGGGSKGIVDEGAWERTGIGELKLTTWVECGAWLGEEERIGEGVSWRGVVGITGLAVTGGD